MRYAVFMLAAVTLCTGRAPAAEARVEFELVMAPGFVATESHAWLEMCKSLNLEGLRIRSGTAADKPEIRAGEGVYQVTGVLNGKGLRLPSGSFTLADKPALAKWVAKLKEGGAENLTARPAAFGLVPKELVAVQEALAGPVAFSTKGEKTGDVVAKLARLVKLNLKIDAAAQQALDTDDRVADELTGLAAGTALVAAVRPLGLVLVPRKVAGQVELLLTDVRHSETSWPVGWPPEKSPRETLPALFNFLEVEIKNTPVLEALDALHERLKTPFVIDYNSLAREQVDLEKAKATLPPGKTYYQKILDRVLFSAKLKAELRVDDAGQPFLWITTVKQ